MAELETKIESIKATSSGFEGRTEAHERHFGVVKASHSSIKDPPPGLFIATFVMIEEGGLSCLCIRLLTAKGCPWAKACSTEFCFVRCEQAINYRIRISKDYYYVKS